MGVSFASISLQHCFWKNLGFQICFSYRLPGASQNCFPNLLSHLFQYYWSSRTFCPVQTAFLFEISVSYPNLYFSWCIFSKFSHKCMLHRLVRLCSNRDSSTQNAFSFPVNGVFMLEKVKNIKYRILWDHLNEN